MRRRGSETLHDTLASLHSKLILKEYFCNKAQHIRDKGCLLKRHWVEMSNICTYVMWKLCDNYFVSFAFSSKNRDCGCSFLEFHHRRPSNVDPVIRFDVRLRQRNRCACTIDVEMGCSTLPQIEIVRMNIILHQSLIERSFCVVLSSHTQCVDELDAHIILLHIKEAHRWIAKEGVELRRKHCTLACGTTIKNIL